MVSLKKMFNGEIIFHFKKETEKIVFSQMTNEKNYTNNYKLLTISGLKRYLCTFLYHPRNILLRGMKYCAPCVGIPSKVRN